MLKSGLKQMWPGELTWQQKFFCYDRTYIFKWCSFQLQCVCSPKCRCQLLWKGMILQKKCLPSIRNSFSDTVAEVDVPTYEGKRNVTFVLQNSHVIQVLSWSFWKNIFLKSVPANQRISAGKQLLPKKVFPSSQRTRPYWIGPIHGQFTDWS